MRLSLKKAQLAAGGLDAVASGFSGAPLNTLAHIAGARKAAPGGGANFQNAAIDHSDDVIDQLAVLDAAIVADLFLADESTEHVSLVLALLRPRQAAEIMRHLPRETGVEAILQMSSLKYVPSDAILAAKERLQEKMTAHTAECQSKVEGLQRAIAIFSELDRSNEKFIMDHLDVRKPALSELIRKHLLTFEDLFYLDDHHISTIMTNVSSDVLALAMKSCADHLVERILSKLSARSAAAIREDLECMGPVRLSDAEAAQLEIIRVARRLEDEGLIVIGRGGDDVLV